MRIDDFSKFVNFLLRTQADEEFLCRSKQRELLQLSTFYGEVADRAAEFKEGIE
jgi:hypothetical protein